MLYCDSDIHFQDQTSEKLISRKRCGLAKNELIFATELCHCDYCIAWLWPKFLKLKIRYINILEIVKASTKMCNFFYRFWSLPFNGTIVDVAVRERGLHFQGQTFSSYAFQIKNGQRQWMSLANLPRFTLLPSCSCSCTMALQCLWFDVLDRARLSTNVE